LQIDAPRAQFNSLQSSSHAIKVSEGEEQTILTLRDSEEVPNRDFVVEWTTKPASMTTARAWVTSHRSHRYALLELNGGPMASEKKEKENRDVYVLLDRSGSMSGEPWRAACRAVHSFARSLPTGTRIDLTLFESSFTHFTGEPRPAGELLKQLGEHASSLIALGVAGGTDLLPAFNAAISRRNRFSGDRPASLLILTDGMVANEQAIIDSARASGTNVHLMGIGLAPNDAMRSAAEATGGQAVFASPHDDLDKMITRFSSRLAKPLLENIDLPEGWAPANENSLIAVFPQEQRRVLLRGDEASEMGAVRAHQDGAPIDLEIETRRVENSALPLLWARERIRHLESRGQVEEALELSLGFNLPSSQTSFVAWDREEQVTVADRHLHQPAHEIEASLLGVGVNTAQSASRSFFEGKKTLYSFIEIECGDEFYDHLSSASRRPPQTPDETVPETKAEEAERAQPSLETPPSKDHLERSVVGETVQPPSPAKAEEKTNLQTPQGDPKSAPGMIARILGIFRTLIRWLTRFLRRNSR
jgi:Mg-chelatase subunit ChlD